jgi:uncharacterized protein (UPF0332 family)
MSTADEFLEAAQTLLDHGAHSGHWRRTVSTAYYAAFHCLIDAFAPIVFQDPVTQDECREWFNHGDMKAVATTIASAPPSVRLPAVTESDHRAAAEWLKNASGYGFTAAPSSEVIEICRLFKGLQERRHQADYFAGGGESKKREADKAVTDAKRICSLVEKCITDNDPDFRRLGAQMLRSSLKPPRR